MKQKATVQTPKQPENKLGDPADINPFAVLRLQFEFVFQTERRRVLKKNIFGGSGETLLTRAVDEFYGCRSGVLRGEANKELTTD